MSDRITIDHVHNNIVIHVSTKNLVEMTNHEILEWIREFTQTLETIPLQQGIVGDSSISENDCRL